jgi:MFS family permease
LGDQSFEVTLVWLIVGLTGSTVLLGSILAAGYIPSLLLLVFGGISADRLSRRGILLASDLLRALVTMLFAALIIWGQVSVDAVFVFTIVFGAVGAFFAPALSALLPSLVPPEQYTPANALRQTALQVATLAGPALGGYLIARYNVGLALAFDAATFGFSVLAFILMGRPRFGKQDATSSSRERLRFADLGMGAKFLLGEQGMLSVSIIFSLANGINNVVPVLLPVLARSTLHISAFEFGLLVSFQGFGALLGAMLIGILGQPRHRLAVAICGGMGVFGLGIAAMGIAPEVVYLFPIFFVAGFAFIISEIVSFTLWQQIIPDNVRGRVFSVMGTITMGMNPLGFLLAGLLGQVFGIRQGLMIGGLAIAILCGLGLLIPSVRRLDARAAAVRVAA